MLDFKIPRVIISPPSNVILIVNRAVKNVLVLE